MTKNNQFTQLQLAAWEQYESVRSSGLFNMFDPKAQLMSGLTNTEYNFCIDNYESLKKGSNQ